MSGVFRPTDVHVQVGMAATLDAKEVKHITISSLKRLVGLADADTITVTPEGKLTRTDYFGHHRGGEVTEELREATELDVAVCRVLEKLTSIEP